MEEFRNVLGKKIMKIKGVKNAIVSVVLEAHKRHPYALPRPHKNLLP
jgi:hypothetical protein